MTTVLGYVVAYCLDSYPCLAGACRQGQHPGMAIAAAKQFTEGAVDLQLEVMQGWQGFCRQNLFILKYS
jgi:hypothetical protein